MLNKKPQQQRQHELAAIPKTTPPSAASTSSSVVRCRSESAMKETSPSPLITVKTRNAGVAAAGFPAEKQTPAIRAKSSCCSASLSSSPSSVNSSSSSSSFYSSHFGSPMAPPPPSPFCSSSAVPFSWEKQPGVPKQSHHGKEHRRGPGQTLPLPPPIRSNSDPFLSVPRKKRLELRFMADPFAVALMECSKEDRRDPAGGEELYWKGAAAAHKIMGGRRRTITDLFGFVDLYTSCKTTSSVVDSTVCVPRSGRGTAAYGLLSRRAG